MRGRIRKRSVLGLMAAVVAAQPMTLSARQDTSFADRYLAAYATGDTAFLSDALHPSAVFVDGTNQIDGREAIIDHITAVWANAPVESWEVAGRLTSLRRVLTFDTVVIRIDAQRFGFSGCEMRFNDDRGDRNRDTPEAGPRTHRLHFSIPGWGAGGGSMSAIQSTARTITDGGVRG